MRSLKGGAIGAAGLGGLSWAIGKMEARQRNQDIRAAKNLLESPVASAKLKDALYSEISQHEQKVHNDKDWDRYDDERRHRETLAAMRRN